MKNMKKIFKRLISVFIIVLLNINTFAAVSGNDGSAFITKAEFDALVNTFNEQMDNYEASLISKVDGAIANYLAGLSNQRTVTLENYAKTYATTMGVTQIEPIKEVTTDGDFAYNYLILGFGFWYCWAPKNSYGSSLNASNFKHTGGWLWDKNYKAALPDTDENRLKRLFFLSDNSGEIKGCIRNITTTFSTCNMHASNPGGGADISSWSMSVRSLDPRGIDQTTSMFNFAMNYGYMYSGSSWTKSSGFYSSFIDVGVYNYSGKTDNGISSQICRYTDTSLKSILQNNYDKRMITPIKIKNELYYEGENGRDTCPSLSSNPGAYYGQPVYSSYNNINTVYSAGAKACGIDAPIYAGVPLCKTDEEGEVTFTINLINANTGDIFITNNPTGFNNTLTPTPDIEFSVDGEAKANRWTTNNGDSGEHVIKFTGEKKKTYWIKYIPAANGPKYTIGDTITQFIEE